MRLLVVGGAGAVGTMTLPHLAAQHAVTVLDPRPPAPGPWSHRPGSALDMEAVADAARDADALVYMAMGPVDGWGSPQNVRSHFDISVTGAHLALWAAASAGVRRAVLTSSMSVYRDPDRAPYPDESVPPDASDFYGVTKRCAEVVASAAAAEWGMDIVVLRLCLPTPDDQYPLQNRSENDRTIATSARDTARAILAALRYQGAGFDAFTISGDHRQRIAPIDKARRLLGWEPLDHSTDPEEDSHDPAL
ncbi:NAD-dependent epimerase/dehydratase family protein [Dactylosporangium sp. CA-139066]|uniref:NAD-dependent epimerase/dehydratase family protein n=1 Tax=Dactylosporangium sp. CA-139066 TaxID=3239930 RepID=UPI003D8F6B9A